MNRRKMAAKSWPIQAARSKKLTVLRSRLHVETARREFLEEVPTEEGSIAKSVIEGRVAREFYLRSAKYLLHVIPVKRVDRVELFETLKDKGISVDYRKLKSPHFNAAPRLRYAARSIITLLDKHR